MTAASSWIGPVSRAVSFRRFLAFLICLLPGAMPLPSSGTVLTNAASIRALSLDQAQGSLPVRLAGVVLDYNPSSFTELFIHDETAGIYVGNTAPFALPLAPGDRVIVEGVTTPGEFAPMLAATNILALGAGTLPAAREVSFARLSTGVEDGQWIRIPGVVRSAANEAPHLLRLDIATSGGRLTARVRNPDRRNAEHLVDAQVQLTGVCFPVFNRKRQLLGVRVSVPSLDRVEILKPAQPDAFALPTRPVNSLLRYDPNADHAHRVKVSGVISYSQPGQLLFLRDATQGLWVKTTESLRLSPGDRVDVVGFPAFGEFTPGLEDAVCRKLGIAAPPQPVRATAAEAATGHLDAELVQMEGLVLRHFQSGMEEVLVLQAEDNTLFRAYLPMHDSATRRFPASVGSRLQLTGICLVQREDQLGQHSFRVLLRTPADAVTLAAAPWWTVRRVLGVLGLTGSGLFAALAWIVTLRRQVTTQTAIIRENVEREAVHQERIRIARDFHDTLEQALVGIGMQLNAASNQLAGANVPPEPLAILNTARSMVRHSQNEVKRSVWNLRTCALERNSLPDALSAIVAQLRNGSSVDLRFEMHGRLQPLPGRIETHLLRICQEATTNALKHAQCRRILISLAGSSAEVCLTVQDDGIGFASDNATCSASGHFGLLGMRERAERIGGSLDIHSAPGAGTRVAVCLPCPPAPGGSCSSLHEKQDSASHR